MRSSNRPDESSFQQIARLESKVQQQKTQIKTLTDTITSNADGIAGKQRLQAQFDQQQNELHEKDKKAQPLIGLPVRLLAHITAWRQVKHLQQLVSARDKTIADLRERLARLVDADNEVRSASLKVHEKIYSMSAELARKQARVKELQAKVGKHVTRICGLRLLNAPDRSRSSRQGCPSCPTSRPASTRSKAICKGRIQLCRWPTTS